jgi:hypothetical protein
MEGVLFLFTDIFAFVGEVIYEKVEFFNRIDGESLFE